MATRLGACRYCYEMAAHQVLGQTWGEWFTKKAHQYGTAASAVSSKVNVGMMYVDLRSFGKQGTMHLMEIAECAPTLTSPAPVLSGQPCNGSLAGCWAPAEPSLAGAADLCAEQAPVAAPPLSRPTDRMLLAWQGGPRRRHASPLEACRRAEVSTHLAPSLARSRASMLNCSASRWPDCEVGCLWEPAKLLQCKDMLPERPSAVHPRPSNSCWHAWGSTLCVPSRSPTACSMPAAVCCSGVLPWSAVSAAWCCVSPSALFAGHRMYAHRQPPCSAATLKGGWAGW